MKSTEKSQAKSQQKSQSQASSQAKLVQSLFAEASVPKDAQKIIEDFDSIIQGIRPLNSRQLQQLPENIRNLSHQMTDDRSSRRLGYMNENIQLSAYVRYFTWWNLVRLTRLFSNLPATSFPQSDCICLDLGSGPLTVVTALYLARPELRSRHLTWYCLDVSANSMALGEEIYLSVVAKINSFEPWQIIRIKGSFGAFMKQKAGFITCANLLNELNQGNDMPPEYQVKKYYEQFKAYAAENARFLIVEPGVPKSSRTLSLLRERFIKDGAKLVAPCPHYEECPMSGFKAYTGSKHKWCNFAFSTESAPKKLQKLSTSAKLPKERATLSFLSIINEVSAQKDDETESLPQNLPVRIISDSCRLPKYMQGFYGCSEIGLVLVSLPDSNNTRLPNPPFVPKSGDLLQINAGVKKITPDSLPKDEKSGAIIIKI